MILKLYQFINYLFMLLSGDLELEPFRGQSDLVDSLPGINFPLNYRHYSGYLSSHNETNLFYWFFESQSAHPQSDPLVLWLSGGPGCSSLFGALAEIAPIRVQSDGTLAPNLFAWNQQANLVFFESPAGVGYSNRFNATEYITNDNETVQINLGALQSFYAKFPHLADNAFYITGQSYAARYITQLATELVNQMMPSNFKGIAIGNGKFDSSLEATTFRPFLKKYHNIANYSWVERDNLTRRLWVYNIKRECEVTTPFSYQYIFVPEDEQNNNSTPTNATEQCGNEAQVTEYLNQPEVLKALHVDANFAESWRLCAFLKSNYFNYTTEDESLVPIIRNLVKNSNLKVLIYSGDADAVCNFYAARLFVKKLKFCELGAAETFEAGGQVFGTVQKYVDNFAFVRFYNAGHMTPIDVPEGALKMFNELLLGN